MGGVASLRSLDGMGLIWEELGWMCGLDAHIDLRVVAGGRQRGSKWDEFGWEGSQL
jgi:hypothetical protein